jgi:hypothetical protein
MAKKNSQKADEVDGVDTESEVIEEMEAFVCPSCGAEVANDTVTCPGCGAFFDFEDGTDIPEPEEEETPPLPADNEEEMDAPAEPEEEAPAPTEPSPQPMEEPSPYVVHQNEVRMAGALKEYSAKRRKRYLSGALSTGLGIIFFVLLWLYTVNQVWVEDTDTIFGLEVILLLVIASVLFIMGMYLILTYPKSSLMDVFATMPRAEPK